MASLQLTKQSSSAACRPQNDFSVASGIAPVQRVEADTTTAKKVKLESVDCGEPLMIEMLDEDHIQQMIEELLDYGGIELRSASVVQPQPI